MANATRATLKNHDVTPSTGIRCFGLLGLAKANYCTTSVCLPTPPDGSSRSIRNGLCRVPPCHAFSSYTSTIDLAPRLRRAAILPALRPRLRRRRCRGRCSCRPCCLYRRRRSSVSAPWQAVSTLLCRSGDAIKTDPGLFTACIEARKAAARKISAKSVPFGFPLCVEVVSLSTVPRDVASAWIWLVLYLSSCGGCPCNLMPRWLDHSTSRESGLRLTKASCVPSLPA